MISGTAPKNNMSPERWCFEDEISFWDGPFFEDMLIFRGVSFRQTQYLLFLTIQNPLVKIMYML